MKINSAFSNNALPLPMRCIVWLVILAQVNLPFFDNPALAADIDTVFAGQSTDLGEHPSHPVPVTTPENVVVNRTVPNVKPPSGSLTFSENPTDEEIFHARVFSGPIVSVGKKASDAENKDLAAALLAHHGRLDPDDASAIETFLQTHPDSPRKISLLANLARHYRDTSQFSKALNIWAKTWDVGKLSDDLDVAKVTDEAVADWASLLVTFGRINEIERLLQELDGRNLHGPAASRVTDVRNALWQMQHLPDQTFKCGPFSLYRIRASLDLAPPDHPDIIKQTSSTNGTSLYQNWLLAQKMGMKYQMAKRHPGAPVPLPAMVHWKSGHFSALTKLENDRYGIEDPTFPHGSVSAKVLDAETDGYFLVPEGALPTGWSVATEAEGQSVWGRSFPSQTKGENVTPYDLKNCCPPCCPMAQYSVHLMRVSLNIVDTPVGYQPPRGPGVSFSVTYNERDPIQPAVFNFSNLGNQWTFDWMSYVLDDPSDTNADVVIKIRGGGGEAFVNLGNGQFAVQPQSQLKLTRTSPNAYRLDYPDGSSDIFAAADSGSPRRVFMTQTKDPAGNTVAFNYDAYFRITSVSDAIGQVTTVSHGSSNPADSMFYKITQVTDPFGRYAGFQYNASGQLTNITDIIGIKSSFTYGRPGEADFINSLTTPYGTSTFVNNNGSFSGRWIQITDPLGGQQRVEFATPDVGQDAYFADPANLTPSGINLTSWNWYSDRRSTFYWDKKAMQAMPLGTVDYGKARQYLWLVDTNNYSVVNGALGADKKVLEDRVFYNYSGQPDARYEGSIDKPSIVGRVLDDGSSQLYQYQYNAIGRPTQLTDPTNRTTKIVYAANNVDVLKVYQMVSATTSNVLAQYTYNSQHLPLTAVDGAGQTTSFGYNGSGQMTGATNALNETVNVSYSSTGYPTNIIFGKRTQGNGNQWSWAALKTNYFTWDGYGRVRAATDEAGYALTFDYDAADRPTKVTYPDGTYEQTVYRFLDPVLRKDRRGHWAATVYDQLRRVTDVQDSLSRFTHLEWCSCGSLSSITDPLGRVTSWGRDLQGRVTSKTFPDNTQINFAYETNSTRMKSVTDAKNQTTFYDYFVDDSLRLVTYSNAVIATPNVAFTYNTNYNRLATMSDGTGVTTYRYFNVASGQLGAGMLSSASNSFIGASGVITYNYDELGRITNRAINSVAQTATYDSLGRAIIWTNALGRFTNTYVGATPRVSTNAYPNGQKTVFSYYGNTNDFRVQTIWNQKSGGVNLSKFDYTYDADGQIAAWTQQADANTPTVLVTEYDAMDQLLGVTARSNSVTGIILKQFVYGYDKAGNRMSEQIQGGVGIPPVISAARYNNVNQLTNTSSSSAPVRFQGRLDEQATVAVGGSPATVNHTTTNFTGYATVTPGTNVVPVVATDYSGNVRSNRYQVVVTNNGVARTLKYDLNGNLTNVVAATYTNSYEWDAVDRLVAINTGTNRSEFTYDGFGRRVQVIEKTNGVAMSTNKYVWCGMELCEERNNTGTSVTKRFFDEGEQIAGTSYYFTVDHLGSVREMTDSSGTIKARYDYDPYGRRTKISGTMEADFGFTGHYVHAASGLCLTLFRAYDADTGRWLSRDPMAEAGGLNLYAYVLNDPLNMIDPYGLRGWNSFWDNPMMNFMTSDNLVNFTAGMGDSLSFGLTTKIREANPDFYDEVDRCSGWYKGGKWTGTALSFALPAGGAAKVAGGADRVLIGTAESGIYRFAGRTGRNYIGQSGEIATRLARHARAGKLPPGVSPTTWEVWGGKLARERAEQQLINKEGLQNLENLRNPLGGRPDLYYYVPTTGEAAGAGALVGAGVGAATGGCK